MSETTVIKLMTREEAIVCVNNIRKDVAIAEKHIDTARNALLELYERRGWEALGYSSWRECASNEFPKYEQAHLYRLLQAAIVERNISPRGEIYTEPLQIPEKQLRPLSSLPAETQRAVWKTAVETAPNGRVTAAHVEHVKREYTTQIIPDYQGTVDDYPDEVKLIPFAPKQPQPMQLLTSSKNDSWRTPPQYIEAARRVMGAIDLDPASSEIANETVKAFNYFDKEYDGLNQLWYGRVWLNPPYGKTNGQSNQGLWAAKLVSEYEAGNVEQAILLVNDYHGYSWFEPLRTRPFCQVDHRISFIDPETNEEGDEAKASSVFIYFGLLPTVFYKEFSQFGPCGQLSYYGRKEL